MSIRLEARNKGTIRIDMDNASLAAKYAREAETAERAAGISAANAASAAQQAELASLGAARAAAEAREAAIHPPQLGENGRWLVWNQNGACYVDSGVSGKGEKGEDGFSPAVSVVRIAGGHRVTITDAVGDHVFDVMDGSGGSAAPEPGEEALFVMNENGAHFSIPAGEGSDGDIVILDGDDGTWHLESGAGAVFDIGVTDGDDGEWHISRPGMAADLEEADVFYGLPSGGTDGQYLVKDSTAEGGARWADLPVFEPTAGTWSVTPLVEAETTLHTAGNYLDRDIVVEAIPYAEVSNPTGGMTATIGG